MGKITEGYFRKKKFSFVPSWTLYQIFGFFINYLVQIGFGLCLISFEPKFSNNSC